MRWSLLILLAVATLLGATIKSGEEPVPLLDELRRQVATLGDETPPELHWNLCLAAYEAGEFLEAEWSVEKAAVHGGPVFEQRRDFMLGNIDYERCRRAEILSMRPEAGAPELDAAVGHARAAIAHWVEAARPDDDPKARRNAQRALEKLAILQAKLDFLREQARRNPKKQEKRPPPERRPEEREKRLLSAVTGELDPAQVKRLMERLDEKRREKLALRRRRLLERGAEGGEDL